MFDFTNHFLKRCLATSAALLTASVGSGAADLGPTVAYNEAVKVVNGKRVVQVPPRNPYQPNMFIPKVGAPMGGFAKYMVEGPSALVQCTVPLYAAEACEASTFGKSPRSRTWIVLRNGTWQGCIGIDTPKRCRAIYPARGSEDSRLGNLMPEETV